jgi:spermidine synthase
MRRRELIAESTTPDGESLTLTVEGHEHVVRVRGETLMSSRQSGSEQAMAKLALQHSSATPNPRILVGGLGMGFTVRAVLDLVGPQAQVCVVELLADVVVWNRGVLAAFADNPLADPRVQIEIGDLLNFLDARHAQFDHILLDLDNGPEAFTVRSNEGLYQLQGLTRLYDALCMGGVLVIWSAFKSPAFERRLTQAGFEASSVTKRARTNVGKGARHTLFLAIKHGSGGRTNLSP